MSCNLDSLHEKAFLKIDKTINNEIAICNLNNNQNKESTFCIYRKINCDAL